MMTVTLAIVLLLYAAGLLAAAGADVWKYIIPNKVVLFLLVLFVPYVLLIAMPFSELWRHLAAGFGVLLVGLAIYRLNVLGAGDVKLLSVVSLWVGLEQLLATLIYVGLLGGLMIVVLFVLRRLAVSGAFESITGNAPTPRILLVGEQVPYGVAIAAGGLVALWQKPEAQFLLNAWL